MENLPDLDVILATATDWMSRVLSFDLPIPDAALIFAFILITFAIRLRTNSSKDELRAEVSEIYRAELLLANRRAQQVKGELRKAELEIEHERQKRRREASRGGDTRRTKQPRPIDAPVPFKQA